MNNPVTLEIVGRQDTGQGQTKHNKHSTIHQP
jgi:hypothetical protein